MFRKLFSRKQSSNSFGTGSRGKAKDQENQGQNRGVNDMVARTALGDAERELFQFDMPEGERGFSDVLDTYVPETRFQYVALTGKDNETAEARVRRLITLKPKTSKTIIPMSQIPKLRLIEESEQFSLEMAIPKKGKPYIRLASVTVVYVPLMSSLSGFTKVKASLIDTRLIHNQEVQSVKFSTNLTNKHEMTLDYCIPRESASKLVINFSREQAIMETGEQWGACQLMLQIEESDFPYQMNFKEVAAMNAIPSAVLENYNVNPNHLDVAITNNHKKVLRDIYENGDLADEMEPIVDKTAPVKYTKSTLPSAKNRGVKTETHGLKREGWEMMEGARVKTIDVDLASIEPGEDMYGPDQSEAAPLKSAMKRVKIASESSESEEEEIAMPVTRFANVRSGVRIGHGEV